MNKSHTKHHNDFRWALAAYTRVTKSLLRINTIQSLMQDVCESIVDKNYYHLAWVAKAIYNEEKDIQLVAASGAARAFLDNLDINWSENKPSGLGPTGEAIRSGKIQVVENISEDPSFERWRGKANQFNLNSCIFIPFNLENEIYGSLNVYSNTLNAFRKRNIPIFQGLAEQISLGLRRILDEDSLIQERIEKQEAVTKFSESLESVIYAMSKAMEERDPYTAGHETRVAGLAIAICEEMGLNKKQCNCLKMAALVHDIGKISVPLELLVKPSRLTNLEFEMIKLHSEKGYQILKDVPFEFPIADIVRQHHEKLDGSGYPLGIKADEILMESRILAVADIVEAMSAHRPYRPALGVEIALEEIQKQAGKQLDASVVKACVRLFREKKYELPKF